MKKYFLPIISWSLILLWSATGEETNIQGKIVSAKCQRPQQPNLSCVYVLTTSNKRTKRPAVYVTTLTERGNTTRSLQSFGIAGAWNDKLVRFSTRTETGQQLSQAEQEVDASAVKRVQLQAVLDNIEGDKLLAWRLELWHDGKLLDVSEYPTAKALAKLGLDSAWYWPEPKTHYNSIKEKFVFKDGKLYPRVHLNGQVSKQIKDDTFLVAGTIDGQIIGKAFIVHTTTQGKGAPLNVSVTAACESGTYKDDNGEDFREFYDVPVMSLEEYTKLRTSGYELWRLVK